MITFVNVFTVLPEKQADALQKIQQVYVEVVKHLTIPKSRHHPPGTLREAAPRLRQFDGTETDTADWTHHRMVRLIEQSLPSQTQFL